ncbi:unnamed protein product [Ectocarpus fasciculatus]
MRENHRDIVVSSIVAKITLASFPVFLGRVQVSKGHVSPTVGCPSVSLGGTVKTRHSVAATRRAFFKARCISTFAPIPAISAPNTIEVQALWEQEVGSTRNVSDLLVAFTNSSSLLLGRPNNTRSSRLLFCRFSLRAKQP